MKHHKKKKKKKTATATAMATATATAMASKPVNSSIVAKDDGGIHESVTALADEFSLASLNGAVSADGDAKGDMNNDVRVVPVVVAGSVEFPSTSSSLSVISGSCSSSCSSEHIMDLNGVQRAVVLKGMGRRKQKKVIAASGTVSTLLGKEYSSSASKKDSRTKLKESNDVVFSIEEAEQFLSAMLGDECELSMAVVRDVLCQCGYDVEKALDVLLDFSSSSNELSATSTYSSLGIKFRQDVEVLTDQNDNFTDRVSDCTSNSFESEFSDSIWSLGSGCRNYASVLASSESQTSNTLRSSESHLPQTVLESLFNISIRPEYEPNTMDWRRVAKRLQSLGPNFNGFASSTMEPLQDTCGDEYQLHRKTANQLWESRKLYCQRAAEAYSKGEREHASYLSELGRKQTKLAQLADEKASHNIFKARNKGIENMITIDLHGQHVKQAMGLLKLHLLFGSYVPSIQTLRVITGCGSQGFGKSKVKQSVIKLLEKERVDWSEENPGTLLIKLSDHREFSFMDSDSEAE